MALGFMIFMRGVDITWAIGRVGLKVSPILGPNRAQIALAFAHAISGPKTGSTFNPTLPMVLVMSRPCIKILKPSAI